MKKIFLLSFLILLSIIVLASGATAATFEILTGQPESDWWGQEPSQDPFNVLNHDSRAQALYLASDLTAAGMAADAISEIQLKVFETPGMNLEDFRVRIQHTTSTESIAWVTSGWTSFYGPTTISAPSLIPDNWHAFTSAVPFDWNGTDNLLIDISRDGANSTSSGGMYVRTGLSSSRMYAAESDSAYAWPFDGMPGNVYSEVPSIKFTNPPIVKPSVSTNIALPVYRFSAQLNASLTDLGGAATSTIWFEWGTTPVYGNTTTPISFSTTTDSGALISGLTASTTYYFRAVAENSAGTTLGNPRSFDTKAHNSPTIDSISISTADEDICKVVGTSTVCKSGAIITFDSVASDPDDDDMSLYICKDETCSNCLPGNNTNCWNALSVDFASNPSADYDSSVHGDSDCEYSLDQEYWAKVCDIYGYCSNIIGS